MRSAVAKVALVAASLVFVGGGCEAIVPSDVPSFTCAALNGACPSGQACVVATGTCIDERRACTFTGCSDGMQCDSRSQVCVPAGSIDASSADAGPDTGDASTASDAPDDRTSVDGGGCRSVGCPCSGSSSCDSATCGDQLTLTPELYAAAQGSVCTRPCCSSADCDPGSVCFGAGNGGNYCVPPTLLARSAPGQKKGGESCAAGTECRSGLCASGGSCEDTCCSAAGTTCGTGASCRFGKFAGKAPFDSHYTFTCMATTATGNPGDACGVDADCKSNLCFSTCQFCSSRCQQPCRSTTACRSGEACTEVLLSSLQLTTNDLGVVCFAPQTSGARTLGSSCAQDADCRSLACDKTSHRCTDACFADSDCAAVSGWRCRPAIVQVQGGGSYSVLECGP